MIGARAPAPVPPLLSSPLLPSPTLSSLPAPAARLPNGSALLIYSSNHCCLPLLCTTSTSVPHLYNPSSLPVLSLPLLSCALFFTSHTFSFPLSLFLSVPSCTTLGEGRKSERTAEKEGRKDGRMGGGWGGRGNKAFDFSLEAPPYFNIGFNRALMP